MRMPVYPWGLKTLLAGKPSVGWLMDLCDENYRHLMRLAPAMREMRGCYLSSLEGSMDLYLEIIEQTPYTTLIHLTYYFSHAAGERPDPDATVRVYHDSHQAEVLDLRQSVLPLNRGSDYPTLEQKWRVNLFLSKWLAYCALQRHCFFPTDAKREAASSPCLSNA